MTLLTLNCQKGYNPHFSSFVRDLMKRAEFDILLLQEVSDTVAATIQRGAKAYTLLRPWNPLSRLGAQTAVLYRSSFTLLSSQFCPVARILGERSASREFGMTAAVVATPEYRDGILVASVHAHSNFHTAWRAREVRYFKQRLLTMSKSRTLIGGDFNTGFPWERLHHSMILSPQFTLATSRCGPTYESQYLEPSTTLNRIALAGAALLGANLRLVLDHIFLTPDLGAQLRECALLPDRVSDHSGIMIKLAPHD